MSDTTSTTRTGGYPGGWTCPDCDTANLSTSLYCGECGHGAAFGPNHKHEDIVRLDKTASMDAPQTLISKPDGHSTAGRVHGQIVLCYAGPKQYQPFVTWWESTEGAHYSGHYYGTMAAAMQDYQRRMA